MGLFCYTMVHVTFFTCNKMLYIKLIIEDKYYLFCPNEKIGTVFA